MREPTEVGDLIELEVTYVPADGVTATVSDADMLIRSPSGVEITVAGIEVSSNLWRFIAPDRIDESGDWIVRINANAGMIDSVEFKLPIQRSRFSDPLP